MSKVDQILAKQKELEEQLKLAMEEERDAVLKDVREKIKRFNFKATDFKGLLKSRVTKKQVEEFLAKKAADTKKSAAPKNTTKLVSNRNKIPTIRE